MATTTTNMIDMAPESLTGMIVFLEEDAMQ